jgi:hypothetical protein
MNTQITATVIQIKADLISAMKSGDKVMTSALRSLLARISNAEAVAPTQSSVSADIAIAGAHKGVGSTEAARHTLTSADITTIINDEITELRTALNAVDAHSDYGQELRQKIATIAKYA